MVSEAIRSNQVAFAEAWAPADSIPVGIRVDFAPKKTASEKKVRTKKFLWLTGAPFGRAQKYDSQPPPESRASFKN
jgi:hypothetical protein